MHFQETQTFYDAKSKTWHGIISKPKYGPDCSLGAAALESLLRNPDNIAQICYHNDKQYTNREIATMCIRVAQHFKQLGAQQCDVIGLCASNTDFVAPLFFGAMLCGLTVSTLDPSFDKDGIKHIYSITKPKMMFCDGVIYERVKSSLEEINLNATIYTMKDHIDGVSNINEFLKETGNEHDFKPEPLKYGNEQVSVVLCSSGTTGLPKGVCCSHACVLNLLAFKVGPGDRLLSFSSLYWASGLFCLTAGTLLGATRVICDRSFNADDFLGVIDKYKVNVIFSPPSHIAMALSSPQLKEVDLSSLQSYMCGGSPVPYSLVEKILPYMPNVKIFSAYGMTEVCNAIALGPVSKDGSTGKLMHNIEVKIVDDDGNLLGPGEKGELCIRIQFPWAGYYGNPAATAEMYSADNWMSSGDIGYISQEGKLYIIDRKKEILKYNNFHFSPTEIERVLNELPGLAEVCVFGLADVVSTHLPAAAIVRAVGSDLTEEEVYNYVAERMAHFKHLRGGVYFLNELPKTVSGKNLRRKVAATCEELCKERAAKKGRNENSMNARTVGGTVA